MVNKVIPVNMPHPMSAVGWDGTNFHILTIDAAGHLQVDNLSSALPTGAATAANQLTEITALQLIDDLRAALHSVNTDELQVNVEDSVLPTGAATAANQATEITDLETMMPYDRGLTKIVNSYSALLAAHGWTNRYVYTVPAGHRALVEAVMLSAGTPDTGKIVLVAMAIDGITCMQLNIDTLSTKQMDRMLHWLGAIWLTAGTVFTILTYSNAGIDVGFTANTVFSEFDA